MTVEAFPTFPSVPPAAAAPDVSSVAPETPAPKPTGAIARLELLLRDPSAFLDALDAARGSHDALASLLRTLVAAVVVGGGIFGAVVGAHRGGRQVVFTAVKLPLVLLMTLVVCVPAFVALARAARLSLGARSIVALALGSCARFALVLLGLAPFVWLIEGWTVGYHRVILAVVAVCVAAGVAAGRLLFSGLSRMAGGVRVGVAFVALFALVGAQASWILRPFVVRPRTQHVPFVRALEGDLFEAVSSSARSSMGWYTRDLEAIERRSVAVPCPEGSTCD